jgi:hypothetical protein
VMIEVLKADCEVRRGASGALSSTEAVTSVRRGERRITQSVYLTIGEDLLSAMLGE